MLLLIVIALLLSMISLSVFDVVRLRNAPLLPVQHISEHPAVSVIIPARNEAARIGRLLDGLARQHTRHFELIVVDDHSTDATAAIAHSYSDDIPNLRILTSEPLPPGWAGKCWACWQGANAAQSSWLLFLDADVAPQPTLIATLVTQADQRSLALFSLYPWVELGSWWERLLIPSFVALIQSVFPSSAINDPHSPIALANGPCILIRRDVYVATGGHSAVRQSVLEDVHLAQVVKSAGHRIAVAWAPGLLRVRLYTRLEEIAEGLRKNAWAGYSAGGWRSAWGGFRLAWQSLGPWIIILVASTLYLLGHPAAPLVLTSAIVAWLLTTLAWAYQLRHGYGLHPGWGILFPVAVLGYFILAGQAWLRIRRGAGVQWKGRAYGG